MERSVDHHEVRASTSEAAEDDLSALWRELAHQTPDARAIMSNLVIFRERAEEEHVDVETPLRDELVVEVARCHPSRVVLLVHARSDLEVGTPLAAAIGILTFGPAEARHAVEQIAVRSQGLEQSLPSIVRRLVLGDLPISVWWTGSVRRRRRWPRWRPSAGSSFTTAVNGAMCAPVSRRWSVFWSILTHRTSPISTGAGWRRYVRVCREALRPQPLSLSGALYATRRTSISSCNMRQARKRSRV